MAYLLKDEAQKGGWMLKFSEKAQIQLVSGPVGQLEVMTEAPAKGAKNAFAIICHPHPLYQGTMHNKVVYTLSKAFLSLGIKTIRFNYRGVGKSDGHYGEGTGEAEDLCAILTMAKKQFPNDDIYLAGFSFGAYVATWIAGSEERLKALVTIAPAVGNFNFDPLSDMHCPWLLVQGDQDEVISPEAVFEFAEENEDKIKLVRFKDCGHYFHGRLTELKDTVTAFIEPLS